MKIRRVVTGHTPDGKSTVASDTEVDAITFALFPGSKPGWPLENPPPVAGSKSPTPRSAERVVI
jgi:hypothetical protein